MDKQHANTQTHGIEERQEQTGELLSDRLMQEINILRLEGALFCFDPREAKQRKGTLTLRAVREQPVTIQIHPDFGQPSVLAYKVLQAIFLKLTEEGCSLTEDGMCHYSDKVSFSQRELSRLVGRVWSGRTSEEMYNAIMQLRTALVHCALLDRETGAWDVGNFNVLSSAFFSGKGNQVNQCVVELDRRIGTSINKRHVAFFNLYRLNTLDTIGVVLYKRVFFHFSNLNQKHTSKDKLRFEKNYEDICSEWLGGLKPLKYKSKILQEQLGRHLEALKGTRLIRKYELRKRANGTGFKLVFFPGQGFFDDYRDYYLKGQQPKLAPPQSPEVREIQQPLELVAIFHKLLGHSHHRFEEKETAYAAELLAEYSGAEVRDLIAYAIEEARKTKFDMRRFEAARLYLQAWRADRGRRAARTRQAAAIDACPYCDKSGHLVLRHRDGHFGAFPCPHDIERINALEAEKGLSRV